MTATISSPRATAAAPASPAVPPSTGVATRNAGGARTATVSPTAELISYLRVSTTRQGESGLGLEAQRAKVAAMATERGAVVVAEFVEV